MKYNVTIFFFSIFYVTDIYGQKSITVPYFETLSGSDVCGKPECYPSIGLKQQVKGGHLFNGNASSILGRKFKKTISDTRPFVKRTPSLTEIEMIYSDKKKGTLSKGKNREFKAKIEAELEEIVRLNIALPDSSKNLVKAALKRAVNKTIKSNVDIQVNILQFSQDYLDTQVDPILRNLGKNEKVVVGLSLMTISGSLSNSTLSDALAEFETKLSGLEGFSEDILAKYEAS